MRLTISWLKKHLNTKASLDQTVTALTNIGLEVEEVIQQNKNLELFKIVKILNLILHYLVIMLIILTLILKSKNIMRKIQK